VDDVELRVTIDGDLAGDMGLDELMEFVDAKLMDLRLLVLGEVLAAKREAA
jgi:hypothetical protein